MPGSVRENDTLVREFAYRERISQMLDIGPGKGTYSDLLQDIVPRRMAIEAWEPYVREYSLESKYESVLVGDARDTLKLVKDNSYDLIVFGDVLEHMTEEEALMCWAEAGRVAKWGLISVPIVHYPQGAEGGNPYEVHIQEHLTPEHVIETYGPFEHVAVYDITGTFIRKFND